MLNRYLHLAFFGLRRFVTGGRLIHRVGKKPRIRVRKTPPLSKSIKLFSGIERFW
jgi:hypothetical protein